MPKDKALAVEEFEAVFRNVLLPMGLTIDVVKLKGKNATVKEDPFKVKLEKPGTVLVDVSEANLQSFLEKESPGGLKDFEVKVEGGKLYVSATTRIMIEIRAKAICRLEILDHKQLWVRLENVEVLGVGAKGLVENQLEKINPILDVDDFPFGVTLEKVTAMDGEIILTGKADP